MLELTSHSDAKMFILRHINPQADAAHRLALELDQLKQENVRPQLANADSAVAAEVLKNELITWVSCLAESKKAKDDLQKTCAELSVELKGITSSRIALDSLA